MSLRDLRAFRAAFPALSREAVWFAGPVAWCHRQDARLRRARRMVLAASEGR